MTSTNQRQHTTRLRISPDRVETPSESFPGSGRLLFFSLDPPAGTAPGVEYADSRATLPSLVERVREDGGGVVIDPRHVHLVADFTNRRRLYYERRPDGLTVSDGLASFRGREIRHDLLGLLLSFKFIPPPFTPYKAVLKLPAGQTIRLSRENGNLVEAECELPSIVEQGSVSAEQPTTSEQLESFVKQHSTSETTVFLSGGFDSSLLASLAKRYSSRIVAFSAAFDSVSGRIASSQAKNAADYLGIPLRVAHIDQAVFDEQLDAVLAHMDEPFADVATVPEALLGRLATAEDWKFAFEGEGADSAFGGSYKFLAEKYRFYARLLRIFLPLLARIPKNRRGKIPMLALKVQMLLKYAADPEPFSRAFSFLHSANRLPSVSPDQWGAIVEHYRYLFDLADDPLNRLAALTFWGVIPYLENRKLEVVERFSNIKLVLPFLDRSVVRSAFSVPGEQKVRWGYGKYPLRKEFGASLPPHARSRRKVSFVPPVADWLLETRSDALMTSTLLPREAVTALVREHRSGQRDHTAFLWALYCAEHWLSQHRSYTRPQD